MAHALGMQVVAEGVETVDQLSLDRTFNKFINTLLFRNGIDVVLLFLP